MMRFFLIFDCEFLGLLSFVKGIEGIYVDIDIWLTNQSVWISHGNPSLKMQSMPICSGLAMIIVGRWTRKSPRLNIY